MPVIIHDNEYFLVAERVAKFREDHPEYSIDTKILHIDSDSVLMKATISNGDNLLSSGHAEEIRGISAINKTSAVENCETSAVGRALAFLKYAGTEIRSADEMYDALIAQAATEHIEFIATVREEWPTISAMKNHLAEEPVNVSAAREAFKELPEETQKFLWKAPTKGGIFDTHERKLLKEPENCGVEWK